MKPALSQITRKEAQAALKSPEELDQLMAVTRARGWIMLLVIAIIIAVALAWSVFGRISKTVTGKGMLMSAIDPVVLYAESGAHVLSFGAVQGQEVKTGQLLLKLGNPPLEKSLTAAAERLKNLHSTGERLTASENQILETAKKELHHQKITLKRKIKETEKLCELQRQQLEAEHKLLNEGLIPKQKWIQSQRELSQLIEQKFNSETQLQATLQTYQETVKSIQQARDDRALEILKAEAQVVEYTARSRAELEVVSPIDGHVLELRVSKHSQVATGDGLVEILPLEGIANRCVAYVDAELGKKIKPGMQGLVSPSIAEPERYGYIVGEVAEVSEVISSDAAMDQVFKNELFVADILKSYPAPLHVVLHLLPEAGTASGFKWTSSSGLPRKISMGTICKVQVEVQRDRPINLFIPWLKKLVGVYG